MAIAGHDSVAYVGFQNGASVIADGRTRIEGRGDLAGKSAVTFMGGVDILGLRDVPFQRITEQADQEIHSNLLFLHRVDVILADGLMVAEYSRRLRARPERPQGLDPTQPVQFRAIFPGTPYHMVFRRQAMQQRFDRCYADLDAAGRIADINRRYVERYRDTVGNQYLGY
jgi:hypothetical protein